MAGTKEGARKGSLEVIKKYGKEFYQKNGEKGGKARVKKGFATNPELARKVGKIGGKNSRRGSTK